jgi:hypothetical protein
VKAVHAHDTPEDIRELKTYVLSEKRSDAIEGTIDCYTFGIHVARLIADALSEICFRDACGGVVYPDGWSDERVVRSLTTEMVELVERIREDFEGSPLIDKAQLPLRASRDFYLPVLRHE